LDGLARWDSGWLHDVFEYGYRYLPGVQSKVSFFPLYPFASGVLSVPFTPWLSSKQSFFLAGLIVSHVAFFLSLRALYLMTLERLGPLAAGRSVWLLSLFPFSFFLSAAYTESLFLALAIYAFRFATRERWGVACVLASLCAVTRIVGFFVAVCIFIQYIQSRKWRLDRKFWFFFITPVPLLCLLAYFWVSFGSPLVFYDSQTTGWNRSPDFVVFLRDWRRIYLPGTEWVVRVAIAFSFALVPLVFALSARVWRRLGPAYAIYCFVPYTIAISLGIDGSGRYIVPMFPLFIVGADLVSKRVVRIPIYAISSVLLALFLSGFTRWERIF